MVPAAEIVVRSYPVGSVGAMQSVVSEVHPATLYAVPAEGHIVATGFPLLPAAHARVTENVSDITPDNVCAGVVNAKLDSVVKVYIAAIGRVQSAKQPVAVQSVEPTDALQSATAVPLYPLSHERPVTANSQNFNSASTAVTLYPVMVVGVVQSR